MIYEVFSPSSEARVEQVSLTLPALGLALLGALSSCKAVNEGEVSEPSAISNESIKDDNHHSPLPNEETIEVASEFLITNGSQDTAEFQDRLLDERYQPLLEDFNYNKDEKWPPEVGPFILRDYDRNPIMRLQLIRQAEYVGNRFTFLPNSSYELVCENVLGSPYSIYSNLGGDVIEWTDGLTKYDVTIKNKDSTLAYVLFERDQEQQIENLILISPSGREKFRYPIANEKKVCTLRMAFLRTQDPADPVFEEK